MKTKSCSRCSERFEAMSGHETLCDSCRKERNLSRKYLQKIIRDKSIEVEQIKNDTL